jgi:hypothetical protein
VNNVNDLRAIPVEINWHSGLPIYASEAFLKAVGDEYGWIGGVDDSGQIRCILPYTVIRKPAFRIARFRLETFPLQGELELEEERSFLNSTIAYFRSTGADMIMPAANNAVFRTFPDGAVVAPYGTFIKDLSQPEETLFNEVYPDCRKNIRRAIRDEVQVKSGMQYLDATYNLIADTLKRSNLKFKKHSEFKKPLLAISENVRISIAECEGVIQACLVTPFSDNSAYSWYSGTIENPVKGAMHLLQWEAIRQFHSMGVKRFNFTGVRINPEKGSKQEGIMNFKLRFGGKLVQGYIWKYSFNPLKFAAYSVAVRLLWRDEVLQYRPAREVEGVPG